MAKIIYKFLFFFLVTNCLSNDNNSSKDLENIIKDYILKNPTVIIESLENYRKKTELEIQDRLEKNIKNFYLEKTYDAFPFIGKKDSKLILTEFIDYNCGYCKKTINTINKLHKNIKDIKIVFIDFPILSESSEIAAKASLASYNQDAYFDFRSKLLEHRGEIDISLLIQIAKGLDLDIKKFEKDMNSEEISNRLQLNKKLAETLNIRGTPTFLLGNNILAGAYEYEKIEEMIFLEEKEL